MKILANKAADLFFQNTSFLYVYYEAVANALDAKATKISIDISIDEFSKQDTLVLKVTDNGVGFTDENFNRFQHILDSADEYHKGVGRLVFLYYFSNIEISSTFENKKRSFTFTNNFEGENHLENVQNLSNTTSLIFTNYRKSRIANYDFLRPSAIKDYILLHFYPRLYQMKQNNENLKIYISLKTSDQNKEKFFDNITSEIDISEIADLKTKEEKSRGTLFSKLVLLYSIEEQYGQETTLISAICADNRTIPFDVISKTSLPCDYKMIFLLQADEFNGKVKQNRDSLEISENEMRQIKKQFAKMVAEAIKEELPHIQNANKKTQEQLNKTYPHLIGYFEEDVIGFIDRDNAIRDAQDKFLQDQKTTLEASTLTDEQYENSLDIASRVLTEYILYRTKIIQKMKDISPSDSEEKIHNLLVPKKSKLLKKNISDVYSNNIWILDDKFMSYSKVLSDLEIENIYNEINVSGSLKYGEKNISKESGRPDITIIFSESPECDKRVDVVIVELKRLGLDLAKKEEIISQIKQRARRLMEFYPEKIQRIWFYGIVDFDKEYIASLIESGYTKLFSHGDIFYKKEKVITDPNTYETKEIDVYILEYETVLKDAEKRNSTFLEILKNSIKHTSST